MLTWKESGHEGVTFASETYKTYVYKNCTDYCGFPLGTWSRTIANVRGNVNGNLLNFMVV